MGLRRARVLGPLAASRLANMCASGNQPCSNSPTAALVIPARAATATSSAGKSPSSLHATTRGFFKVSDRRRSLLSRAVASFGNAWADSMIPTTKLAHPFRLPPKRWELDHGFSNFVANNKRSSTNEGGSSRCDDRHLVALGVLSFDARAARRRLLPPLILNHQKAAARIIQG